MEEKKPRFYEKANEKSSIDHVIAIMSGKGGVGKSLVTSLLALAVQRSGRQAAIMDADITGPSIPRGFGVEGKLSMKGEDLYPALTDSGIQLVSTNLLLDRETDPIIWKGPLIGSAVKQFWTDVVYPDVNYLFIDMPPGTGDVPLTVFQTIPVDGIIIVSSPQELVKMIVEKAINMAGMMGIPVLGLVENMSYFHAPDTGHDYAIFGESHVDEAAADFGLPVLARLPLDPEVAERVDRGQMEALDTQALQPALDRILALEK